MQEQRIYLKCDTFETKEKVWTSLFQIIKRYFSEKTTYEKSIILQKEWINQPFIEIGGYFDIDILLKILIKHLNIEIYGLAGYNVVDGFSYWHYKNKKLLRRLDFGLYGKDERTWNIVEGKVEAWETEVFFNEDAKKESLFSLLEQENDLNMRPLPSYIKADELNKLKMDLEQARLDVNRIFDEKELNVGNTYPFIGNCMYEVLKAMEINYFQKAYKQIIIFERYTFFGYLNYYLRKQFFTYPAHLKIVFVKSLTSK